MVKAGKNSDDSLGHGIELAKKGQNAEAEAAFREAIRARPESVLAHLNLGVVLEGQGRHTEAEQVFRRATELAPDSAEARFDLGVALDGQSRYEEAERAYRRAIELDHSFARAHLNLGVCLERGGRDNEAESSYRTAVAADHKLQAARLDLGGVLERLGRLDDAEKVYREAIATQPDDPYANLGLGITLAKCGKLDEAIATYRESIRLKPDSRAAHSALGLALDVKGEVEQAIGEYRQAIALPVDPTLAGYRPEWDQYKLGRALTVLARTSDAAAAYRGALALRPNFPEACVALADVLVRLGLPEQAEDYARQGVSAAPAAWRERSEAWRAPITLAAVCVEIGEKFDDDAMFDEALAVIDSGRKQIPANSSPEVAESACLLGLLRGYALAKVDRPDEARTEFRKCAKGAPPNSPVGLAAARNERRLNARLRNRVDVPRWLPYAVSVVIVVAGIDAGWLVQTGRLAASEFLASIGGGIVLLFAAFSLPALTRLKIGPAELQKETLVVPPARLELLTATPIVRVTAQSSTPDISLKPWTVATETVAVLAIPGRKIRIRWRPPTAHHKFLYPVSMQGQTDNFHVYVTKDVDPKLAGALLSDLERDLATLSAHFGGAKAGPFNVILIKDPLAYHLSCDATDLYCGATSGDADQTKALCATQVVEVLAAASGLGWNCQTSAGEGLSRALAEDLYPKALEPFAAAPAWLDSARPDFVTKSAHTDTNTTANGCAVLFLNYLHYELKFGWKDILAARGANLGETYRALTGKTDAFERFSRLLASRFPVGKPSSLSGTDNVFPITVESGAVSEAAPRQSNGQ